MGRRTDIREALLASGKNEFLTHGFEGASLRTICRRAGLTTGAFYNQFAGKEELFEALVAPMLVGFEKMYEQVFAQELADFTAGMENEQTSITYAIDHKDEFRLLFDCSKGTKYENFKERLIGEVFYPTYQAVFDRHAGKEVDPDLVRIILHMKFEEYMEIIYGGYPVEKVEKLIRQLTVFSLAGFEKLMEEVNKEEI